MEVGSSSSAFGRKVVNVNGEESSSSSRGVKRAMMASVVGVAEVVVMVMVVVLNILSDAVVVDCGEERRFC